MKTKLLYTTSICLALSAIASLETYACANETNESIASSRTMQAKATQSWEEIINSQKVLTMPQCREAALYFHKENKLSLSGELFRQYLMNKPLGEESSFSLEEESSFYRIAAGVLELTHQDGPASQAWDQFFHITPQPNASDYLHASKVYFFTKGRTSFTNYFHSYISHPDFEETSKIYHRETVRNYLLLGDLQESIRFWNLYFARSTTVPSYSDYEHAAHNFEEAQQYEKASYFWKQALALSNDELIAGTFMSASISFNKIGDHNSLLSLLDKAEKAIPNPPCYIYRHAANLYLSLNKEKQAAHMWDLFFRHPNDSVGIEDYANAAQAYFQNKQLSQSYEMWKKYFSYRHTTFEESHHRSFALAASAMKKYEESTAIWAILNRNNEYKDFLFHTTYARDLCALGRFEEATQQYNLCFDELIASKNSQNLALAAQAYSKTRNIQKALAIHKKRIAFGFLPPHTRFSILSQATPQKAGRTGSNMISKMAESIKLSIGQTSFDQATKYYNQAKNETHPELQELRETLINQYNQCLAHFLALKKPTTSKEPSVSNTRTSSSSQASSAPSTGKTITNSSSGDLENLKNTTTQMENTFALFEKAHKSIKEADKQQKEKEYLRTVEHTPSILFNDATSAMKNLRGEYSRAQEKRDTSKNVSSKSYLSGAASSSSSSSTSTSTSMSTPTTMDVQWHITPAAESQYKRLSQEQLVKFKKFRTEVEQNPFLDQSITGTFSGKAKKLKNSKNLYSRRFDKKNRFIYELEVKEGQIQATILELLTHYKILERS